MAELSALKISRNSSLFKLPSIINRTLAVSSFADCKTTSKCGLFDWDRVTRPTGRTYLLMSKYFPLSFAGVVYFFVDGDWK